MTQITPDNRLFNDTQVRTEENTNIIEGGTTEGNNLFHSFEQFSVPDDGMAFFNNAREIENISISITGSTTSSIDGTIKANGNANLFVLNTNGIIFGRKARLDLGGSFVGTTANSMKFADGSSFESQSSQTESILTVSVPVELRFLEKSTGKIQVNGAGNQINVESPITSIEFDQKPKGLSVRSGQTLALVGNIIDLNGGVITTEGGQIYSIGIDSGSVAIDRTESGLTLVGDDVTKYGDINLDRQSLIDASGEKAGIISLIGKNINLLNASFILAQNQGNSSGSLLNVNAAETLTLSGRVSKVRSNIRSETFNTGKGADLNISAHQLLLEDGGRIRTNAFSDGVGGDININISDSIQLSTSSIIATTFAEGNGGNIYLSASQLRLKTAGVTSSTNGAGNGGTLNVNADLIEIVGTSSTDRASIATTSFATGDAGNLTLNTAQLRVIDGASLSSSSFSSGNAGDMTVNASESIEVKGKSNNSRTSNNPQSTIRAAVQSVPLQARKALGLPDLPSGDAGNLVITTPFLNINGIVSVENQGTGKAGKLEINADSLLLDDSSQITAATTSGKQGDININTSSLLSAQKQ